MSYRLVTAPYGRLSYVFRGVYNTMEEAKAAKRRIQGMSGGTCKNLKIIEEKYIAESAEKD